MSITSNSSFMGGSEEFRMEEVRRICAIERVILNVEL